MLSEDIESDDINIPNELILCLAFWKAWQTVQLLRDYLLLRQARKFEGSIEALLDKFAGLASIPTDSNAVLWGHQKFFDEIQQPLTYPVKKDMATVKPRLRLYEQT
ncbi:hypothetical protein MPH_04701 [Macrophomina phaseolina MS6]|uniref:Uncharacterized protein n=1 Tax=Macrophomina phaseolina (strain MS6) TaxID=1126212 RepID=K2R6N1_MACPH|nr:hypothetical protein MPH_04701 [Macrophomina phaseolina MS6]